MSDQLDQEVAAELEVSGIPPVEDPDLSALDPGAPEPEAPAVLGEPEAPPVADPPAVDPHEATRLELERKDREQHDAGVALRAQQHELDQFRALKQGVSGTPDEQRAALKAMGFDASAATELALGGTPEAPDATAQLAAMKKRMDDRDAADQDASRASSVNAEHARLASVLAEKADTHPVLASTGTQGVQAVYRGVLAHVQARNAAGIQGGGAMPDQASFDRILVSAEAEVKGNVLTNINELLKNKVFEDHVRSKLGKPSQAAPPAPVALGAPPSKAITDDLNGEPITEERVVTAEQAEQDVLDYLDKAIRSGAKL